MPDDRLRSFEIQVESVFRFEGSRTVFVGQCEFQGYVPEGTVCEVHLGARSLGVVTLEPEMIPKVKGPRESRAFSTHDAVEDEVLEERSLKRKFVLTCRLPK